MPKISQYKLTEDILEYRKNYYQENKLRISSYQKDYYRLKKGLPIDYDPNWRGEKIKVLNKKYGKIIVSFN